MSTGAAQGQRAETCPGLCPLLAPADDFFLSLPVQTPSFSGLLGTGVYERRGGPGYTTRTVNVTGAELGVEGGAHWWMMSPAHELLHAGTFLAAMAAACSTTHRRRGKYRRGSGFRV